MNPETSPGRSARGRGLTRRRAITLIGAAAGLPLLAGRDSDGSAPRFAWRGRALGAEAGLILAHGYPAAARRAAALCLAEVARLERIFSLFDPESEICRLNRDGRLPAPSHDLRVVLAEAQRFGRLSGGVFDVTVQPLWRLYAEHFARHRRAPDARDIAAARALVDYRAIDLDRGGVRLARPAMAVTLNGIAQGYTTDRAADLLRDAGFARVLVQLGETRALDRPTERSPWRLAVPDPRHENPHDGDPRDGAAPLAVLDLENGALATSSALGTRFEPSGRHHHLLDPASGRSAPGYLSVTVQSRRATVADALSTALAVTPPKVAENILRAVGEAEALVVMADGRKASFSRV
jgi:thiamine biosynthesis lipoprotein